MVSLIYAHCLSGLGVIVKDARLVSEAGVVGVDFRLTALGRAVYAI